MDKARHPNVIRTWSLDRTKMRCQPLHGAKTPRLVPPRRRINPPGKEAR